MDKKTLRVGLLLGAVVALGAFVRFYDITNYPPGLFPDEAANGEDVLLILDGDVRPFYPRGNGREALFFYLQALMVKMFGIGAWPMHAASALVGTATVAAIYFATRPWFGRLAGLLAAFFLATNHWHITLSRTGFRAIMIPLFVALFTAFVGYVIREVKGKQAKARYSSYVYAALAGVALAGGFYTYIAYRVMIGVVLVMAILILLDDWILESRQHSQIHARDLPHLMRYWRQLLVGAVAALIVLAPLGWYFAQEPSPSFRVFPSRSFALPTSKHELSHHAITYECSTKE
jgi:4-amino-4-deoxy-L-arabinose transferase-like glycosyltransferase